MADATKKSDKDRKSPEFHTNKINVALVKAVATLQQGRWRVCVIGNRKKAAGEGGTYSLTS